MSLKNFISVNVVLNDNMKQTKEIHVNVNSIAYFEKNGSRSIIHLTLPDSNSEHVVFELAESCDGVASAIDDATK